MTEFTGREWEEECLGSAVVALSLRSEYDGKKYLPWRKALEDAVKFYGDPRSPWDPTDPSARTSDLSYYVAEALGIDPEDIEWYPALRRCFDIRHSVDMFCRYGSCILTFDLTTNPDKIDGYKADMIWGPWEETVELAKRVAVEISRRTRTPQGGVASPSNRTT